MVNKDENSLDSFNDSTEETELELRVETNLVLDISIQAVWCAQWNHSIIMLTSD